MTKSALLVMDVQSGIVERVPGAEALIARLQIALKGARGAAVPVVYVTVGYREGYPEVSSNNRDMLRFVDQRRFLETDPSTDVAEAVHPQQGDIRVVKRRVGAFTGGDLDIVLRSRRIDHLVLAGISTSGSVLTTVREAADRDFAVTVLADACTDADREVHRVLLEKVFPRQADVVTVEQWVREVDNQRVSARR